MTKTQEKIILFDPGFAQHTTILSINLEYLYASFNQFKNFGQKKLKFKMAYPQIVKMVENNVGFCLGSLLWASYAKTLNNVKIEGNPCLGDTYNEEETVEEADFSIEYFDRLKKDVKYYLGTDYEINSVHVKILELYKEFLTLNKGFSKTETTNDLVLPAGFKPLSEDDAQKVYDKIQQVIKSGKLLDLLEVFNSVYEG